MRALSPQNRVLGVLAAVEAGVALSYFTHGRWVSGVIFTLGVAFFVAVYFGRRRKTNGRNGGRRY